MKFEDTELPFRTLPRQRPTLTLFLAERCTMISQPALAPSNALRPPQINL
jgi:hypothetical protein